MNLAEWIELCAMSSKSGTLSGPRGKVVLVNGQVIHAASEKKEGTDAFFELSSNLKDENWSFAEGRSLFEKKTIALSTNQLLLETARMSDENAGQSPAPENENADFDTILHAISQAKRIAIFSHIRPDGDCLGSQLALGFALRQRGHEVYLFNGEGMSYLMTFLPGSELVFKTPEQPPEVDLIIAVDTSSLERLGKTFAGWNRTVDILFDHHISNSRYAKLNHIRADLPATAALMVLFFEHAGWAITPEVATQLYTGLMTDTGCFRYRGTNAETFRMAALLVEAGADPADLARATYQSISPGRFKLLRVALNGVVLENSDRLAWLRLTPEMFQETGARQEDTEGLVERLLEIETVQVSAVLEDSPPDTLRVSLRSKNIDVSAFAQQFGGGGHRLAAGIRIRGNLSENREKILTALRETVKNSS